MTTRRLVHLGIGNFARAHTLLYTAEAGGWEAAVFTGRGPRMAEALTAQDGRYGLVVRGPKGDEARIIDVITAAHPATDVEALSRYVADPATAVVTLTITEKGYSAGADPAVSAPARLAVALRARREAGVSEPIALVSCDNLPGNGEVLASAIREALTAAGDSATLEWMAAHVDVISTMVDRITPAAGEAEQAVVAEQTGLADAIPVVTEPFHEWVLQDAFRGARPAWENAGAVLTDDVAIHEMRKLRFLNGAHSLMAYAGQLAGHTTVPGAIGDPAILAMVRGLWDEAARTIDLPDAELTTYRAALEERFSNHRLADRLIRIAADGTAKLPVRILPVIAELGGPDAAPAQVRALAAWCAWVMGRAADGHEIEDPRADDIARCTRIQDPRERVAGLLGLLGEAELRESAGGDVLIDAVLAAQEELPRA